MSPRLYCFTLKTMYNEFYEGQFDEERKMKGFRFFVIMILVSGLAACASPAVFFPQEDGVRPTAAEFSKVSEPLPVRVELVTTFQGRPQSAATEKDYEGFDNYLVTSGIFRREPKADSVLRVRLDEYSEGVKDALIKSLALGAVESSSMRVADVSIELERPGHATLTSSARNRAVWVSDKRNIPAGNEVAEIPALSIYELPPRAILKALLALDKAMHSPR